MEYGETVRLVYLQLPRDDLNIPNDQANDEQGAPPPRTGKPQEKQSAITASSEHDGLPVSLNCCLSLFKQNTLKPFMSPSRGTGLDQDAFQSDFHVRFSVHLCESFQLHHTLFHWLATSGERTGGRKAFAEKQKAEQGGDFSRLPAISLL